MLGDNVKKYRIEQRYTRKQLGDIIGIAPTTIQYIENGTNDNPTIKTVMGLSKALKVPIQKLLK